MSDSDGGPFHRPFRKEGLKALRDRLRNAAPETSHRRAAASTTARRRAPPPPAPGDEAPALPESTPLAADPRGRIPPRAPPSKPRARPTADPGDARPLAPARAHGPLSDEDEDGYVLGRVPRVSDRVVAQLRRGEWPHPRRLDLHGMREAPAAHALTSFIEAQRQAGERVVLVVTGQGRHSAARTPVLRTMCIEMLRRGPLRRHILAFCSARPRDGGAGALYVLLRKP